MGYRLYEPGYLKAWRRVAALAFEGIVGLPAATSAAGTVPRMGVVMELLGPIALPICWAAVRPAAYRG